eukprot:m.219174 g.219174  ORF g.219174 m.219174 type:complete len:76 (+) comp39920_c0_seq32:479-706(+)
MIYGPNSVYLHSNILPILGAVVEPPILAVVSQYISHGSLFSILHSGSSAISLMGDIDLNRSVMLQKTLHTYIRWK